MKLTLNQKQALFTKLIAHLIDYLNHHGFDVVFAEAYRTPAQAAQNAKDGIGIANSLHTLRLAIDLLLFKDGTYLKDSKDYKIAGEFWKSLSGPDYLCCWGGDFKKPDGDHFSIEHNGTR